MRVDIPVGLQLLFGPVSNAAVEEDCTSGLVIEVFMTRIRLVLMLCFFMVAHKAACQTLSKAFSEVYEDMLEVLLALEIFSQRTLRLKTCSVVLLSALKLLY